MIYLDNSATSFPKPQMVYDAVYQYMTTIGASPGRGGYRKAIDASETVFNCRFLLSKLLSIPSPERILFTKNATEALNTAIFSFHRPMGEIIISSMEHNSVRRAAFKATDNGKRLKIAQADKYGRVSPESIEKLITKNTSLISVIHSSNVSGTINDIYSIQRLAKKHNIPALFDCSQSAGIIPIDASGLDMVAFSGHKGLFGPMGTGALYVREGIDLRPMLYGGTGSFSESALMPDFYPDRLEAGTVNAPAIAGLSEGVKFIMREGVYEKEREITTYLYDSLREIPNVIIPGERERTSAVSVTSAMVDSVEIADTLGEAYGVCVRAGLHCAPMAHRTLNTFHTGTIRFSPGFFTTKAQVDFAVKAFKKILAK